MTTDPFPDRTEAVALLARQAGWNVSAIHLSSYDARGDTFVTGHLVDVVGDDNEPARHTVYLDVASDSANAALIENSDGERLAAWLYPADPRLPALAPAVYDSSAGVLLRRMGIDDEGIALDVLTYRPGKRAVVRATTTSQTVYLKIVRPDKVDSIRELHETWGTHAVPVPSVISWAPEGLLALAPLPGTEVMGLVDSVADPSALVATVRELSERIAQVPSTAKARTSLARRLDWYRTRLTQLGPESAARIGEICDGISALLTSQPPVPRAVTIHGDLHLGQIFAAPQHPTVITGVLDIDTAGLGDPADDAAALAAHLLASAELSAPSDPARADRVRSVAAAFMADWHRAGDSGFTGRARAIAATHLLGHCLSGSVTVERCLALAGAILESEKPLIPVSLLSHD